jgi:glycosyltransferase involved in cell wall biosynthesis
MRRLERLATACATEVIYNSPSLLATAERERAVRRGRGRVLGAGSGNGIDAGRFATLPSRAAARTELGIPLDATVVGFVGRLTKDKGIVDLVDALDRLDAGTLLLLVGDEEAGDPIPDATRRAIAAAPNIVSVPWMDDTRTAYRAMDVLAFPSYREGLPNVPLEAQLCGVPVVAYRATGTVDAIAPGNVLVEIGDVAGLAAGIRSVVVAPGDRLEAAEWVRSRFDQQVVWVDLRRILDPT